MAVTVTVHTSRANPAPINLTQEFPVGSTVFTGQATNISLTLDDARGCHAVVGAKILSGGGPGFTGLAYRSSDHRLSFAPRAGDRPIADGERRNGRSESVESTTTQRRFILPEASRGRDLCPEDHNRTAQEMAADVDAEAEQGWSRVGLHRKLKLSDPLDANRLHHDHIAVTAVPGRRSTADEAGQARVVGEMERSGRRVSSVPFPAPVGSPVTEAGISATAQCQKPDPLGASGSYMVTV